MINLCGHNTENISNNKIYSLHFIKIKTFFASQIAVEGIKNTQHGANMLK